jgi:hypothetical protein
MLDPLELPRGIGPQLHGLEGRLHDVRGPQMNPVFLGIVEEGDQPLSVSTEAAWDWAVTNFSLDKNYLMCYSTF